MVQGQRWQRLVLSLGLIASSASPLVSQTSHSPRPAPNEPLRARLEMLKHSSQLRLHDNTGRHEGRLLLRTPDSVGISSPAGEARLPLSAVDSMWVRRHYTLPGLLIGTAAGAGAYFLITNADQYEDSDTEMLDNVLGAAVWAGSAVVGGVVGRLISGWKRAYP